MIEDIAISTCIDLGIQAGMIEEITKDENVMEAFSSWFARSEAIAIASKEKAGTDEIRLANAIATTGEETNDQSLNIAFDISNALAITYKWHLATPSEADLHDLWDISDASNLKISRTETEWTLHQAFSKISSMIDVLTTDPTPEKTAKVFLEIAHTEELKPRSMRFALILAPYLIRKTFGLQRTLVGIAKNLELDKARADADIFEFTNHFIKAAAGSANKGYTAVKKIQRLKFDIREMIDADRDTPALRKSITFIMTKPIFTTKMLRDAANLTTKGSHIMLSKIEKAGAISKMNNSKKNVVYVCHKAIGL